MVQQWWSQLGVKGERKCLARHDARIRARMVTSTLSGGGIANTESAFGIGTITAFSILIEASPIVPGSAFGGSPRAFKGYAHLYTPKFLTGIGQAYTARTITALKGSSWDGLER
jgi:hypothetical protein